MGKENNGEYCNWKPHTFGILPEGSLASTSIINTKNFIEQGQKTWTDGQTWRDLLQNHLDANTHRLVHQLTLLLIDPKIYDKLKQDPSKVEMLDKLINGLLIYQKGKDDLSSQAERETQEQLSLCASALPIRSEFHQPNQGLNFEAIKDIFRPESKRSKQVLNFKAITETFDHLVSTPPEIHYRVIDRIQSTPGQPIEKWVGLSELSSSPYQEMVLLEDPNCNVIYDYRYQINGVQINDSGPGFDSKLTTFYKSTKVNKPYYRGKFGEGTKLSLAHLLRNKAHIILRSAYHISGVTDRDRIWQQQPFIDKDQMIKIKNTEFDTPCRPEISYGSATVIDLRNASSDFKSNFVSQLDPRSSNPNRVSGLARNCLDYSLAKYYYPLGFTQDSSYHVGVSLEANSSLQYVQGLLVENQTEQRQNKHLFSYNFLDSSILRGRDRNQLTDEVDNRILWFWHRVDSPILLQELISRVYLPKENVSIMNTEKTVLDGIITFPLGNNPSLSKTKEIVMDLLPSTLNLSPESINVVYTESQIAGIEGQNIISLLKSRGYNLIQLNTPLKTEICQEINLYYQDRYQVYNIESIKNNHEILMDYTDSKSEKIRLANTLFQKAISDLTPLLFEARLGYSFSNLKPEPLILETMDPSELAVQLDIEPKSGQFVIKLRPDQILSGLLEGQGTDYWLRRIQVEIFAIFYSDRDHFNHRSAMINSQAFVQDLLNHTLSPKSLDLKAVPKNFNHHPSTKEFFLPSLTDTEKVADFESQALGLSLYNLARHYQTSLVDLESIVSQLDQVSTQYRQKIEDILKNRLIVENGTVSYFKYQENFPKDKSWSLVNYDLSSLPVVDTYGLNKIYKVDDRYFVKCDFTDNTTIRHNKEDKIYVFHQGRIYDFGKYCFQEHTPSSYSFINFDRGCFFFGDYYQKRQKSYDLDTLKYYFSRVITINQTEKNQLQSVSSFPSIIETPIPTEYGINEWDNPVRVFQDLAQNHLDASPDGHINLTYKVIRKNQVNFVPETALSKHDKIIGLSITDNGDGYHPDDLGTLGKSTKKNPFFAGKYGEGQKMVSAAAARNGLSLSFSSISSYQGEKHRWTAQVKTRKESVIVDENETFAQRVIYHLNHQKIDQNPIFTSATILELPDVNQFSNPEWQKWLQVFDPRIKDENGNGGLSRYVLSLRSPTNPNIIDLGPIKILLDEPGAVYENGLLIKNDPNRLVVGYDVPEVSSTRERNSVDEWKLNNYFTYAYRECQDVRYFESLLSCFKKNYLKSLIQPDSGKYINHQDIRFDFLTFFEPVDGYTKNPFWSQTYNKMLNGYYITSEIRINEKIEELTAKMNQPNINQTDKAIFSQHIFELQSTLVNSKHHLSHDRLIKVKSIDYDNWSRLFPSVEDFAKLLGSHEISIDPKIIYQLANIVSSGSQIISQTCQEMEQDSETRITLQSIIKSCHPNQLNGLSRDIITRLINQRSKFWSDTQNLIDNKAIYVAPSYVAYEGLANQDRIGFNEKLLTQTLNNDLSLVGTSRHELLHQIFNKPDYSPEFIMLLYEIARHNFLTSHDSKLDSFDSQNNY